MQIIKVIELGYENTETTKKVRSSLWSPMERLGGVDQIKKLIR